MKKITHSDYLKMGPGVTWDHINALQTELERKEGGVTADVHEIENILHHKEWNSKLELAWIVKLEIIDKLTSHQGFVPNWEEAPEWADRIDVCWAGGTRRDGFETTPSPTPKTREMTQTEKTGGLVKWYHKTIGLDRILALDKIIEELDSGKSLDDLCRAANISTTVTEEGG